MLRVPITPNLAKKARSSWGSCGKRIGGDDEDDDDDDDDDDDVDGDDHIVNAYNITKSNHTTVLVARTHFSKRNEDLRKIGLSDADPSKPHLNTPATAKIGQHQLFSFPFPRCKSRLLSLKNIKQQ